MLDLLSFLVVSQKLQIVPGPDHRHKVRLRLKLLFEEVVQLRHFLKFEILVVEAPWLVTWAKSLPRVHLLLFRRLDPYLADTCVIAFAARLVHVPTGFLDRVGSVAGLVCPFLGSGGALVLL